MVSAGSAKARNWRFGLALIVASVAVALLAAALTRRPGDTAGPAPATTAAPYRVERVDHHPGDCLTWDQDAGAAPTRAVATVACDRPHLVEVTGRVVITETPAREPTDDELDALTERLCRPVDEAHLGGPLDPHGRYYSAGIQPSPEGWRDGDREVWCALGSRDGTESGDDQPGARAEGSGPTGRHRPFEGRVSAGGQFWRYPRGSCLAAGRRAPVACTAEHEVEFTGTVTVPEAGPVPPLDDVAGWDALVGEACRSRARAYLGRDPVEPLTSGWLGVDPAGWRAGDRMAHCLIGERDAAGGWTRVTGSDRPVPT